MKTIEEMFIQVLEKPEELEEAKIQVNKDKVLQYQVAQHRKGNKITWDEAMQVFIDAQKKIERDKKKAIADAKRAEKKAKKALEPKIMTRAQFMKRMKSARKDFLGDNPDLEIEQVAYDMADNLLYDSDILNFVNKEMGANVHRDLKREYVAGSLVG
jgi:anion-transporting  ArsA/GET3 family ATPase